MSKGTSGIATAGAAGASILANSLSKILIN